MRGWALIGGAMLLPAAAFAQAPVDGLEVNPTWLKKPGPGEYSLHWPYQAVVKPTEGRATVRCTAGTDGKLRDCGVVSEEPAGFGFGDAALAMTPYFLMKPGQKDGRPVSSEVRIPIHFPALDRESAADLLARNPSAGLTPPIHWAWTSAPSFADLAAAYPVVAARKRVAGYAALDCAYTSDGRLGDCRLLREMPQKSGFGAAGLALAGKFAGPPANASPALEGGRIRVDLRFGPEMLGQGPPAVTSPPWLASPSSEDFAAAFANIATRGATEVRVVMRCLVAADGRLAGCVTESETPPGVAMGAATTALADKFRMSLWNPVGLPTIGGQVRVAVRYQLPAKP